jgi:hypothetical protein
LRCPCCATLLALPSPDIAYLVCLRWYDRAGACPCRYSGNLDPGQWWSLRSQAQNTAEYHRGGHTVVLPNKDLFHDGSMIAPPPQQLKIGT